MCIMRFVQIVNVVLFGNLVQSIDIRIATLELFLQMRA